MADTYDTIVQNSRIISGGGPATRVLHSGDGTQTWKAGQLLKMSSGVLTEVVDNAAAVEIDTDDTSTSGARLFIALEDVDAATSGKVKVQEITADTELYGPMVSTAGAQSTPPTAPESIVGTSYTLWQQLAQSGIGTAGWFAPDKNDTGSPCIIITGVDAEEKPFGPDDANLVMNAHSTADPQVYNFVKFKFKAAIFA